MHAPDPAAPDSHETYPDPEVPVPGRGIPAAPGAQPRHDLPSPVSPPRVSSSPVSSSCERGSVTAETAVLLPVLLVVLAAAVGVLACVAAQLECIDAARAAARAAARGDRPADVRLAGERLAPTDARVHVSADDETVEVVVSAEVRPFGRVLRLPAVPVSGRAVAAVEPGAV